MRRAICPAGKRHCLPVLSALVGLLLLVSVAVQATTFSLNGQNEARYRRGYPGNQRGGVSSGTFENILELTAGYDRFRFYLRQRYLEPSEFGVRQTGLAAFDKRYLEYRADDYSLRGGSFYRIWGRGLMFGTTEKTEINLDTGLEGLLLEGSMNRFDAAAFKGVHSDTSGAIIENAEGAWVSYRTPWSVRLGTSVVYMDETNPPPPNLGHPPIDRRGYEAEWQSDMIGFYATYMQDKIAYSDNYPPDYQRFPHGFYSALSLSGMNWGAMLDYKNYKLLVQDPYSDFPQPFLQYPPTALPEVTMTLLDRVPRAFKPFSNEVGAQLDLTGTVGDFNLRANLTKGSEGAEGRILPSSRSDMNRYNGIYTTVEQYPSSANWRWMVRGGYLADSQVLPPDTRDQRYTYRRSAGGGEYEAPVWTGFTLKSEFEIMWYDQDSSGVSDTVGHQRNYRDEYLALTLSHSPQFSFSASAARSGDKTESGGLKWDKQHRYWPSGELMINIAQGHQLRLFGGHERGGLRCSGGICRWVNPFRGAKVTLTSQF